MILTDGRGHPIARPQREDYTSLVEYARALYQFNDQVSRVAIDAFADACRKAMR